MQTPAIIYLLINVFSIGVIAAMHGKPKTGNYNVFPALIFWLVITVPLLYWGGFFNAPS